MKRIKNILLPALLAIGFLGGAIFISFSAWSQYQFEQTAIEAEGEITGHEVSYFTVPLINLEMNESYPPIIKFNDRNGATITFQSNLGTVNGSRSCYSDKCIDTFQKARTNYPVGSKYKILYQPNNPQDAYAVDPKLSDAEETSYSNPILYFFVFAITLCGIGCLFFTIKAIKD